MFKPTQPQPMLLSITSKSTSLVAWCMTHSSMGLRKISQNEDSARIKMPPKPS